MSNNVTQCKIGEYSIILCNCWLNIKAEQRYSKFISRITVSSRGEKDSEKTTSFSSWLGATTPLRTHVADSTLRIPPTKQEKNEPRTDGAVYQVCSPVVLQIGHKFLCVSHCLMHSVWKLCPHSSAPRSSPFLYSSYKSHNIPKQEYECTKYYVWDKNWFCIFEDNLCEEYGLTRHILQGSVSGSSVLLSTYFCRFKRLTIASSVNPVDTFPMRSSRANSSWRYKC